MNKTKRALISLIVVTTVFCLSMIFNIQLRDLQAKDTVATKSDAADATKDNAIQSFAYTTNESDANGTDSTLAAEEALITPAATTGQNNSPTTEASASDKVSKLQGTNGDEPIPSVTPVPKDNATDMDTAKAEDETVDSKTKEADASKEDATVKDASDKDEDTDKKPQSLYANIGISVAKDYVNIRKEPSTDAEVLGKLYRNSGVTIIKTKDDWYYVESGSVKGYVNSDYIKTGIPDDELIEKYGTLTACVDVDGLNVRKDPTTDAKKLTVVYENEKYPVVKTDGDWVEIDIEEDDTSGYVKKEYVDIIVAFTEAVSKEEEQKLLQLQAEQRAKEETKVRYGDGYSYTDDDIRLLACLIHSEAGTQSYEGKLAVANVVLNRVKSSKYPDSIKSVIYQSGQFSVARSGSLQKQLDKFSSYCSKSQLLSIKAAKDALEGANNIGSRLYFHSYKAAAKKGYTEKSSSVKIGDHLFW